MVCTKGRSIVAALHGDDCWLQVMGMINYELDVTFANVEKTVEWQRQILAWFSHDEMELFPRVGLSAGQDDLPAGESINGPWQLAGRQAL